LTVSLPVLLTPFANALILTAVVAPTGLVWTAKVALRLPAGTVTLAGMDATAEPPVTVPGEKATLIGPGFTMSKVFALDTPPPGAGLQTVTAAEPAATMSPAGISALGDETGLWEEG